MASPAGYQPGAGSELARRLQSGELVRLYRDRGFLALVICYTLAGLLFLRIFVAVPSLISKGAQAAAIPLLVAGVFWWLFTIYIWGQWLFCAVRLENSYFEYWDWRGRMRRVDFSDLLAVALDTNYTRKGGTRWLARVCHSPEAGRPPRWTTLYSGRQSTASVLAAELIGRCAPGPSAVGGDAQPIAWYRPGRESEIPALY